MTEESSTNGSEQFRKFVDDFLSTAAPALEDVVNSKAYGEMLGQAVGNLVALNRMNNDVMDLTVRNLRIAGRADVVSLHRQLARNEDKLEMVLEIVERIEEELAAIRRLGSETADRTAGPESSPARTSARKPTGKSSTRSSPRIPSDSD